MKSPKNKKLSKDNQNKKKKIILPIFFVILITYLSFIPSLKNGFTNWDDHLLVTENPQIVELSLRSIKDIFTSFHVSLYNPLAFLSYAIEYHFFKLDPRIYHTINLVFHLLNCILVFWLISLLTDNIFISFIVALLFGIHPLHVESVAWISTRKDVLCAFFFLISLISYLYYLKDKVAKFYFISLFVFVLSLLSKPMAVTLPVVLVLCDYLLQRKFDKNTLIEKIPFFFISVLFGIITIHAQSLVKNIKYGPSFTFFHNILNASFAVVFYLIKMIIPVKLSCLYPYPDEMGGFFSFIYPLSIIIIVILTAVIILSKKYDRKMIFGIGFFLVTILPVLQLVPVGETTVADRYTYIPYIGLFYFIIERFYELHRKKANYFLTIILIGIITVFSFLTWSRCKVWRDSITLWSDALKNYPNLAIAYNDRGAAYAERKKYDRAIVDYNEAIRIKPDYADAYNNRGLTHSGKGEYDKAITDYTQAIKVKPDKASIYYYNRGIAYDKKGEYDKAISDYSRTIEINPKYASAYYNRGLVYDNRKEYERAITDYSEAIRIKPNYVDAYNNRGLIYYNKGEHNNAINDYNQALKFNPGFAGTYNNRGLIYYARKEYDKAIADYTQVIRIDPNFAGAYQNRALAYTMKKDYDNAWKDVRKLQSLGYQVDPKLLELLK